jgi:hypothetical protein
MGFLCYELLIVGVNIRTGIVRGKLLELSGY